MDSNVSMRTQVSGSTADGTTTGATASVLESDPQSTTQNSVVEAGVYAADKGMLKDSKTFLLEPPAVVTGLDASPDSAVAVVHATPTHDSQESLGTGSETECTTAVLIPVAQNTIVIGQKGANGCEEGYGETGPPPLSKPPPPALESLQPGQKRVRMALRKERFQSSKGNIQLTKTHVSSSELGSIGNRTTERKETSSMWSRLRFWERESDAGAGSSQSPEDDTTESKYGRVDIDSTESRSVLPASQEDLMRDIESGALCGKDWASVHDSLFFKSIDELESLGIIRSSRTSDIMSQNARNETPNVLSPAQSPKGGSASGIVGFADVDTGVPGAVSQAARRQPRPARINIYRGPAMHSPPKDKTKLGRANSTYITKDAVADKLKNTARLVSSRPIEQRSERKSLSAARSYLPVLSPPRPLPSETKQGMIDSIALERSPTRYWRHSRNPTLIHSRRQVSLHGAVKKTYTRKGLPPSKSGWLEAQASDSAPFRSRFVVWSPAPGTVSVFSDEQRTRRLGSINLQEAALIEDYKGDPRLFCLKSVKFNADSVSFENGGPPGPKLVLRAPSWERVRRWVKHLALAMAQFRRVRKGASEINLGGGPGDTHGSLVVPARGTGRGGTAFSADSLTPLVKWHPWKALRDVAYYESPDAMNSRGGPGVRQGQITYAQKIIPGWIQTFDYLWLPSRSRMGQDFFVSVRVTELPVNSYKIVLNPGVVFRSAPNIDARDAALGSVAYQAIVQGREEIKGWVRVLPRCLWLPVALRGKLVLQKIQEEVDF